MVQNNHQRPGPSQPKQKEILAEGSVKKLTCDNCKMIFKTIKLMGEHKCTDFKGKQKVVKAQPEENHQQKKKKSKKSKKNKKQTP